jgi:inward rectifier potassium channel
MGGDGPRSSWGGVEPLRRGFPRGRLSNLYYWTLTTSRTRFVALLLGVFLVLNLLFALAYMAGGGVENARPGSLLDAFFFSVQTMATIGYGKMAPVGVVANFLVTAEAAVALFGVGVAAGLIFARITRPDAGIRFSRQAVITRFDGRPTLMFRLANQRSDQISEARIHVVLVREETSAEGYSYRRLRDLPLIRSYTPVFELSWSVLHVIDEASPLFGCSPEALAECQATLTVLFSGHHESYREDVHVRHLYEARDIAWNVHFADIFCTLPDGRRALDYGRFDEVVAERQLNPPPP